MKTINWLMFAQEICFARKTAGKAYSPSEGAVHAVILHRAAREVAENADELSQGSDGSKILMEGMAELENGSALLAKLRKLDGFVAEDGEVIPSGIAIHGEAKATKGKVLSDY